MQELNIDDKSKKKIKKNKSHIPIKYRVQYYTPGSGIKVAVIYWPCVRQVVACAYIYGVVKAHTERIITQPSNRPVSNGIKMMNIVLPTAEGSGGGDTSKYIIYMMHSGMLH